MSMFTAEYQDFKREDPTVLVKVTLYDDQKSVIKPTITKAKLVQNNKYAGDYTITQDGDQYCLSTKQLNKLPSGDYGMELWADDGSIYPSAGFIPIRIHRNADNSLEQVDPTVDINQVIEDLHSAGLNLVFDKIEMLNSDQPGSITSSVHDGKNHITLRIPRGLRGETGPFPDLRVVSVTKSAPGSNPNVTYTKRDGGYDVSYVLPQGPQGENWKESDKQEILDEVKKELDSKISDAYTKAAADMDKWLETVKF